MDKFYKLPDSVNIDDEILATYNFYKGIFYDMFGRKRKFKADSKSIHGGPVLYFETLTDLFKWEKQVIETRQILRGDVTTTEKIYYARL